MNVKLLDRSLKIWAAAALLMGAAPAQAQDDWAACATEGQLCRVNGETMVRFGADGHHVFRLLSDTQPCSIETFGSDPAPGRVKRCELSSGWRSDPRYRSWRHRGDDGASWRFCAAEGGMCTAPGQTPMRFGIDGQWAARTVSGRVSCDVKTFGDPSPGRPKVCQLADPSSGGWALCAGEGEVCRVPGSTTVRYGADGRYAERNTSQDIACNNAVFGDPVPGLAKQCEYRRSDVAGPQRGTPAGAALPWGLCAPEGALCSFRGAAMLRYGADGRYAYREAFNGLQCSNESFGIDPAPGAAKRCELLKLGR